MATSNSAYVNFAFSYADVSKWSAWRQPCGTAPLNRFPSPGGSPPEREKGHENYEDTLTDLTQGPLPQPISITFSAAACGAGKTFWATRF